MAEAAEETLLDGMPAETSADVSAESSPDELGEGQAAEESGEEPVLYTVKVGGKEEKVTFDDLQAGFMRQSDYTRKTQEVAAEKQRLANVAQLADALDRDPHGTVSTLARFYGVQLGGSQPAGQPDEELSEIELLRREFQGFAHQQQALLNAQQQQQQLAAQQAQTRAQIEQELASMHDEYGDFDNETLIKYAVDNNLPNLSAAYRAWQFDVSQAKRIAELNAATEAKRRGQVVGGGHNTSAGATVKGTAGSKPTVREAWAMALEQTRS